MSSLSLTKSAFTFYPNFGFWTNAKYQYSTHMWVLANDTYNTIYFVSRKTDLGNELGIETDLGKSVRVIWEESEGLGGDILAEVLREIVEEVVSEVLEEEEELICGSINGGGCGVRGWKMDGGAIQFGCECGEVVE